jgi:hypothetical protein
MASSAQGPRLASKSLAFETEALRKGLQKFLNTPFPGKSIRVGDFKWGVYAFFDYDEEPIYVGQSKESLRTRIRRHLTNQRTDAVAMNVLDPFEVFSIEVWPLPNQPGGNCPQPTPADLNALERAVWEKAIRESKFGTILNEKDPPQVPGSPYDPDNLPRSLRGVIVSPQVAELRGHPDVRLARRAETIARLSRVVVERQVSGGLRRTLVTQANRLASLAGDRFAALGGAATVAVGAEDEPTPANGEDEA